MIADHRNLHVLTLAFPTRRSSDLLGNFDSATALMLAGGAGLDALVLSNPWTIDGDGEEAPAEVVRDHYRRRLADPAAIGRLLTGQVSIGKLLRSQIGRAHV